MNDRANREIARRESSKQRQHGACMSEYIVIIGLFILGVIAAVGKYGEEMKRIIAGTHEKGEIRHVEETMGVDETSSNSGSQRGGYAPRATIR